MKKEPEDSPVYFKIDGQRFRNTRTVKLHTGTSYRLDMIFKPAQHLESVNVHGSNLEFKEQNRDHSTSSYRAHWSTAQIPLTRKGEREHVPIILKITDKGTLKTSLQAKFYRLDDTQHCEWGCMFTAIELECNANEHRNHVEVAKETFRSRSYPEVFFKGR